MGGNKDVSDRAGRSSVGGPECWEGEKDVHVGRKKKYNLSGMPRFYIYKYIYHFNFQYLVPLGWSSSISELASATLLREDPLLTAAQSRSTSV